MAFYYDTLGEEQPKGITFTTNAKIEDSEPIDLNNYKVKTYEDGVKDGITWSSLSVAAAIFTYWVLNNLQLG